jgi:hypothetical protein
MELAAKLDDYGKPAWITVMILAFVLFWPVGLAILAYLIWSGRMGCWKHRGYGRWYNGSEDGTETGSRSRQRRRDKHSSGNVAFDDYREETLRRLEDEQAEFETFLDRLRQAKDKAEFEQFMADRQNQSDSGRRTETPDDPEPQPNA